MAARVSPSPSPTLSPGPLPLPGQGAGRWWAGWWNPTTPVVLLTFAAEAALMVTVAQVPDSLMAMMILHGLVSVALLLWGWTRWRQGRMPGVMGQLLIMTVPALGVFGAGGVLLGAVLLAWWRPRAPSFEDWYLSLFPVEEQDAVTQLYNDIISGREATPDSAEVRSFQDIMASGTLEQKQAVMMLLSRAFRPVFAPILRQALNDRAAPIRVQAGSAVAHIENKFVERGKALLAEAEAANTAETWRAYARHLDEYAYTGLLDPQRERITRQQALDAYLQVLDHDDDDLGARINVARLLLRDGKVQDAATWIAVLRSGPRRSLVLGDWYMECLYLLREYAALREMAAGRYTRILRGEPAPRALVPALSLWAGHDHLVPETPSPETGERS